MPAPRGAAAPPCGGPRGKPDLGAMVAAGAGGDDAASPTPAVLAMRSHPSMPPRSRTHPRPGTPDEQVSAGCGWFDSSLDLHQGLAVVELDPPQAAQAQVPLHWWVRSELDRVVSPPVACADAWSGQDRH